MRCGADLLRQDSRWSPWNTAGIQKNREAVMKQKAMVSTTLEHLLLQMFFLLPFTLKLMQMKPAPRAPPIKPRIMDAGNKD